ncbi:MAG TPA: carbamoyltransferase N-terminal domain-containing protein [Candidatus Acidoferrales bacterium]
MYILGLSAMSHDSAAALLKDGGIVAAIEEGKLARTRTIGGIPRAAIQFCLEHAGIGWRDVAQVAIASRPPDSRKASRKIGGESNDAHTLRQMSGLPAKRFQTFDHHLCHASSAFFASPFERALIVTMDETGDGRAGLVAIGKGGELRARESIRLPQSLAWIYSQFTQLLGFRPHSDEHKTQWLSLTGEPEFAGFLVEILRRAPGGPPHLNPKYFRRKPAPELCFTRDFFRELGIAGNTKQPIPELPETTRANLASSLQNAFSTVLCEWLEGLREKSKEQSLCLAGGLFLNPLLVGAIEANTRFDHVFVQPAAGNEGTALGAAWLAWHENSNRPLERSVSLPSWGPSYSNAQIKLVLDNCKANYRWLDSEDMQIAETLRLLANGKIVAFFQGATEFGPRALGDRSLLASPWAPYIKENLNDFVKHRESFRPFALAIPEEDSSRFFSVSSNARFLTTMAKANEAGQQLLRDLPDGFLLPNNLVRLQVVRETDNPLFWKLLKRSGENAPAPILVNTSFNLFGEPLVVTPRDAVRSYFCSGTDALVAGNFLLEKH